MGDARTATSRTLSKSESPQTVPGWSDLLDRLEEKDERIAELEGELDRLEAEIARLRAIHSRSPSNDDSRRGSKAKELVDALRRTAG